MDWEQIWKRIERAGFVVTPLCAIAGAYYTAGTYYGWDKQATAPLTKDHAGGIIMTLPPWLGFALLGVAIVSLLTSWGMILIRRRTKNSPGQEFTAQAGMISINEIEFNTGRLTQAAPWLELYLTCFNASGFDMRPFSVTGRVNVSGQEFHSHIELIDVLKTFGSAQFFRIGLKIPVSASEAQYCLDSIKRRNLSVVFAQDARITLGVTIHGKSGPSPEINVWLPGGVSFNPESLRTDPYLPWRNPLNLLQR